MSREHPVNPDVRRAESGASRPRRVRTLSGSESRAPSERERAVRRKAPPVKRRKNSAVIVDINHESERPRVVDYVPLDATFLTLVIILTLFGLVMVFSASYAISLDEWGDATHYFVRQLIFAGLGIGGMLFFTFWDYYNLRKFAYFALIVAIILLVAVLIMGRTSGNAKRWIDIGPVGFQPSEIAKVAVVLFLARWCEDHRDTMNRISNCVIPLVPIAIMDFLLYKEPHISALILITVLACAMIFVGGMAKKWAIGIGCGVGGAIVAFFMFGLDKLPYIQNRITAWQNPFLDARNTGYQTVQSLYAIGSGGFFGVGLGNSRQKQLFLPEAHNDYIFSIVCEELGFVGAAIIIILFILLIWRGMKIAINARDRFGFLLVTGIMTMVTLQFLLNIAVVTNAIPVTGMSLPFFSYGGTALAILLSEMGMVLNVSRQSPLTAAAHGVR